MQKEYDFITHFLAFLLVITPVGFILFVCSLATYSNLGGDSFDETWAKFCDLVDFCLGDS